MYLIRHSIPWAAAGLLGLLGCPDQPSERPPAPVPAEPAAPPEPPPPPFDVSDDALDVVSLVALVDDEPMAVDPRASPVLLPVGATLRIEVWQRLVDYRTRLTDDRNRLVPFEVSTGPVAVRSPERPEPGGTWIRVRPDPPLVPGESYRLRIEGERSDAVRGHGNRTYADLALELQVAEPVK